MAFDTARDDAGNPPADRLDAGVADSEADYCTPIGPDVLDSQYRCAMPARCDGAYADQRLSRSYDAAGCHGSRTEAPDHALSECGGPLARSLHLNGGAVCLRCEYRPTGAAQARNRNIRQSSAMRRVREAVTATRTSRRRHAASPVGSPVGDTFDSRQKAQ